LSYFIEKYKTWQTSFCLFLTHWRYDRFSKKRFDWDNTG